MCSIKSKLSCFLVLSCQNQNFVFFNIYKKNLERRTILNQTSLNTDSTLEWQVLRATYTCNCHTWSGSLSSSLEVIVKYNATWVMLLRSGLEGAGASPLINLMRWLSFLGGVWWCMTGEDILGWTSLCIFRVIWKNFCKGYFLSVSFNREGTSTTELAEIFGVDRLYFLHWEKDAE